MPFESEPAWGGTWRVVKTWLVSRLSEKPKTGKGDVHIADFARLDVASVLLRDVILLFCLLLCIGSDLLGTQKQGGGSARGLNAVSLPPWCEAATPPLN